MSGKEKTLSPMPKFLIRYRCGAFPNFCQNAVYLQVRGADTANVSLEADP